MSKQLLLSERVERKPRETIVAWCYRMFARGCFGQLEATVGSLIHEERRELARLLKHGWSGIQKTKSVGHPPKRVKMPYTDCLTNIKKCLSDPDGEWL